ncbi:MAG: hypothetical protein OEZ10_00085 [Gammaproteobacteria bacterium]|nr:hypothetical protein [Gammaproteobacteria bacterium]
MKMLFLIATLFAVSACGPSSDSSNDVLPINPPPPPPPPGGGTTVDVVTNSTWLAWQDGIGNTWQPLTGSSFDVSDAEGKFGIAYKCQTRETGDTLITIHHMTIADYSSIGLPIPAYCDDPVVPSTIVVTPVNRQTGNSALVAWGDIGAAGDLAAIVGVTDISGSISCYGGDILGIEGAPLGGVAEAAPEVPSRYYIERDIASCTDKSIDFAGPGAFPAAAVASITVVGGYTGISATFETMTRSRIQANTGNGTAFAGVPLAQQLNTDGHWIGVTDLVMAAGEITANMGYIGFKDPVSQTVTVPTGVAPTHSVSIAATTPYKMYTTDWSAYADSYYSQPAGHSVIYGGLGSMPMWHASFTTAWLGGTYTYTLPDLSGVTGWDNAWGISAIQLSLPILNSYALPAGGSWADYTRNGFQYRGVFGNVFTDGVEYAVNTHTVLTLY